MATKKTRVLVIGGGATGVGIVRDLALRGLDAALVEQQDLAHGASFRFHGLLHSGARYAVKDPAAAAECIRENRILKQIAPTCVKNCGGLFLQLPEDSDEYTAEWLRGCARAGIEVREVAVDEIRRTNPNLTPRIKRAYAVPDGIIDGSRLVWTHIYQAERYGAQIFTYSKVTAIHISNGCVTGAEVTDTLTGEVNQWECELIINAAGVWADEVAHLAGAGIALIKNKGSLLVFNQPLSEQVLNRLRPPSDGDIIVPHHTVTILGTTSIDIDSLDNVAATAAEVDALLEAGRELIPDIGSQRLLRAYAGVRPLTAGVLAVDADSREISREFTLLDHSEDGVHGFISLVGGKLTTYRLIAEKAVDHACKILGIDQPCRTGEIPLVDPALLDSQPGDLAKYVRRYGENGPRIQACISEDPGKGSIICECEDITSAEVEEIASWSSTKNLDDLRRKTRIGMGTCQGLYCALRSLGTAWRHFQTKPEPPLKLLRSFLENRYRGQKSLLWEAQIRECELTLGVYSAIYNLERVEENDEI